MSSRSPDPQPEHALPEQDDLVRSPDDAGDEDLPRLGGTPQGRAVADALRALHKTCRSFVLYDSGNEAIRKFLGLVKEKFDVALAYGDLALVVRPFELTLNGEVVYLERDRERSLAFRLYRDGVRRLSIEGQVTWEELLKLLEVLSLRTVGASTAEDDTVTLLHKAGFQHVGMEAIEGFMPDEEMPEDGASAAAAAASAVEHSHVEAPRDFDLPLPEFEAPALLVYRPLPDRLLEALRAEEGPGTTPALCLRLVEEMGAVVVDITDPTTIDDLLPFTREVRDYLLIEGALPSLARLVTLLLHLPPPRGGPPVITLIMGEEGVLPRVVELLLKHGGEPELERLLLPRFPERTLGLLLERLAADPPEAQLVHLRELLREFARANPGAVLQQLADAVEPSLTELVTLVREVLRDHAYTAGSELLNRPEPSLQHAGLKLLHGLPVGPALGPRLIALLSAPDAAVRHEAAALLGRLHDHESYQRLITLVKDRGGRAFTTGESEAVALALSRMNPDQARAQFQDWLKPASLLERLTSNAELRFSQAVAVDGLAVMPGDVPEVALRNALNSAEGSLRGLILHGLARRRGREGRHG